MSYKPSLEYIFNQCLEYYNKGNMVDYAKLSMKAVEDETYDFNLARVGIMHHLQSGNFLECINYCERAIFKLNLQSLQKDVLNSIKSICYFMLGNFKKMSKTLSELQDIKTYKLSIDKEINVTAILKIYAEYLLKLNDYIINNKSDYTHDQNEFIKIIGDSNSLSPAWRKINIRNCSYTIKPNLVIGTKAWDIANNKSYTQTQGIKKAVKSCKPNSLAIFCFGKIDTRINEGIFKYSAISVKENIKFIINNYVSFITNLCTEQSVTPIFCGTQAPNTSFIEYYAKDFDDKKLNNYLDIPRLFNQTLSNICGKENFIDIYNFTTNDKGIGKPELFIDNIHLQPTVLEKALNA